MTVDDIIDGIFRREGPYCDRPHDRGGPTCWGITLAVLSAWRGVACSAADVAALGQDEARKIYRRRYVDDPHFDRIVDEEVRAAVVDAGVNHGQARAAKWLQAAAGAAADGVLGPASLTAINAADPRTLRRTFAAARVRFYGRLIADNHDQAENAAGWADRAAYWVERI